MAIAIAIAPSLYKRLTLEVDKIIEELASEKPEDNLQNLVKQQLATIDHTPDHPVYTTMIREALTNLNEDSGSTKDAISHFILTNYDVLQIFHAQKLIEQLENLVKRKELAFTSKERYKLVRNVSNRKLKLGRRRGWLQEQRWRSNKRRHLQNGNKVNKDRSLICKTKHRSRMKEPEESGNQNHSRDRKMQRNKGQWLQKAAKLFTTPVNEDCTDVMEEDTCRQPISGTQTHDTVANGSAEPSQLEHQVLETIDDHMEAELQNRESVEKNCNTESQAEPNFLPVENSELESTHIEMIEIQRETQRKDVEASKNLRIPQDHSKRDNKFTDLRSNTSDLAETEAMGRTTNCSHTTPKMDNVVPLQLLLRLKDKMESLCVRTRDILKEQQEVIDYMNSLIAQTSSNQPVQAQQFEIFNLERTPDTEMIVAASREQEKQLKSSGRELGLNGPVLPVIHGDREQMKKRQHLDSEITLESYAPGISSVTAPKLNGSAMQQVTKSAYQRRDLKGRGGDIGYQISETSLDELMVESGPPGFEIRNKLSREPLQHGYADKPKDKEVMKLNSTRKRMGFPIDERMLEVKQKTVKRLCQRQAKQHDFRRKSYVLRSNSKPQAAETDTV